jgi:hypothetical protein
VPTSADVTLRSTTKIATTEDAEDTENRLYFLCGLCVLGG